MKLRECNITQIQSHTEELKRTLELNGCVFLARFQETIRKKIVTWIYV